MLNTIHRPKNVPVIDDPKKTRILIGDGSDVLKAPGLRELHAVRIGNLDYPLSRFDRYPVSANEDGHWEHVTHEIPMIELSRDELGEPILLRSVLSNDGVWQKGLKVVVIGEWETPKEPDEPEKRKEK